MRKALLLTGLGLLVIMTISYTFNALYAPVIADAAIGQMENSDEAYVIGKEASRIAYNVNMLLFYLGCFWTLVVWTPLVIGLIRKSTTP